MCLDIDPDSVIHKHLNQKINSLYEDNYGDGTDYNPVIGDNYENEEDNWVHQSKHKLTMLPSFHISLGEPPQTKEDLEEFKYYDKKTLCHMDIVPIIGDITLAPICISQTENKKSAWIPLHPYWIYEALRYTYDEGAYVEYQLNLNSFDSFDHRCDECPVQHLHVSVANLTGNPHDSIARPEDCIIDTINN